MDQDPSKVILSSERLEELKELTNLYKRIIEKLDELVREREILCYQIESVIWLCNRYSLPSQQEMLLYHINNVLNNNDFTIEDEDLME